MTLIALGISSIIMMTMSEFFVNANRNQAYIEARNNLMNLEGEIRGILGNEKACTFSFVGLNPVANTTMTTASLGSTITLKDASNATQPAAFQEGAKLNGAVNMTFMLTGYTPSATNPYAGIIDLKLIFNKVNDDSFAGPSAMSKTITLYTILEDASAGADENKIKWCIVKSAGMRKVDYFSVGSAGTATLPAGPEIGDVVIITRTGDWESAGNHGTVFRNGSKINNVAQDLELDVNIGFSLVYVNSSFGWAVQ